MPSPCNNFNVVPIKVSQLVRYKNIDVDDFFLTIESGSKLYSRKSTFGDLVDALGNVTGSYTGSFSGSFKGKSSGSFSGSYWGSIISKNTKATGSFYGNKSTISGSFSGSFYGSLLSKNTKASGSFSGSHYGSLLSKNTKASGSFSGSHYGSLLSKNTKASGSFSGSFYGSLLSKNTKASGSFSGSHYGKVIGSKGSLITGSFRGIDNITNFKGTGKKVSFNGTASYAVSASYALTASSLSLIGGGKGSPIAFAHASWTATTAGVITPLTSYNVASITLAGIQPTGPQLSTQRRADVVFTNPVANAEYTVLAYCSWNNPNDIIQYINTKHFGDIGTSVVSNRTSTGFRITTFVGWFVNTVDDGDDYWWNTSIFPDYSSFVVFK